jgi:hypothetical protein
LDAGIPQSGCVCQGDRPVRSTRCGALLPLTTRGLRPPLQEIIMNHHVILWLAHGEQGECSYRMCRPYIKQACYHCDAFNYCHGEQA